MEWSKTIKEYTDQLTQVRVNAEVLQKVTTLLDLTRLNDNDTEANIAAFIEKAYTPYGDVAAVCVYPQFVRLVAAEFAGSKIKAGTVANFPSGEATLETVLLEIGSALQNGAQEVDVVFPYQRYMKGDHEYAQNFVSACKAACGDKVTLKMILETGAINNLEIIAAATKDALLAGADFIKTSTGKINVGPTLEAAATILLVIKEINSQLKHPVGIKISGGLREIPTAAEYILLADKIMGKNWVSKSTFRLGSSHLIDEILKASSHA